MINYNLKEDCYKNHPLDKKWATLLKSPMYRNHLCTVIDNHNEVIDGKYTSEEAILLLHMSPRIRCYISAKLFSEFLYVGIWSDEHIPTYTNWEYKYEKLSTSQIIEDLESVLYGLEPMLNEHTCMGYQGDDLFDDPNSYSGRYLLNDEEEYKITRTLKEVKFIKEDHIIHQFLIDENRFRKAVEVYDLKEKICNQIDMLLDNGELLNQIIKLQNLEKVNN